MGNYVYPEKWCLKHAYPLDCPLACLIAIGYIKFIYTKIYKVDVIQGTQIYQSQWTQSHRPSRNHLLMAIARRSRIKWLQISIEQDWFKLWFNIDVNGCEWSKGWNWAFQRFHILSTKSASRLERQKKNSWRGIWDNQCHKMITPPFEPPLQDKPEIRP